MAWVEVTDDLYALGLNLRQPVIVRTGCGGGAVTLRFCAPRRWRVRRRARARAYQPSPA